LKKSREVGVGSGGMNKGEVACATPHPSHSDESIEGTRRKGSQAVRVKQATTAIRLLHSGRRGSLRGGKRGQRRFQINSLKKELGSLHSYSHPPRQEKEISLTPGKLERKRETATAKASSGKWRENIYGAILIGTGRSQIR